MSDKLVEMLYDNQINKENYQSLLDEYNVDNFVVFLGSGINCSVKGIPDWKNLYQKLCENNNCKIEEGDDYPSHFSRLFSIIDEKEVFDDTVFQMIRSQDTSGPLSYMPIVRAFDCFITTNYYEPIEVAFSEKQKILGRQENLKKYYFRFPASLDRPTKDTLTYLHGSKEIGFCVLRKRDYEYFYPSLYEEDLGVYVLENSLEKLLTDFNIVFLGCSLEDHIESFFVFLKNKLKKKRLEENSAIDSKDIRNHYWISSDSYINNNLKQSIGAEKNIKLEKAERESTFFNRYNEINIKPVLYTGGHIFVEQLCDTLAGLKENRKTHVSFGHDDDRSIV